MYIRTYSRLRRARELSDSSSVIVRGNIRNSFRKTNLDHHRRLKWNVYCDLDATLTTRLRDSGAKLMLSDGVQIIACRTRGSFQERNVFCDRDADRTKRYWWLKDYSVFRFVYLNSNFLVLNRNLPFPHLLMILKK